MKKILSIAGAIALAASLFVACSSEAADDGRNSYIDNYSLDAVDITVKAYPGFNYVSWGENKKGGTVTVYRDDGVIIPTTKNVGGSTINLYSCVDASIKGGVKYTYTATVKAAGNEVHSANDGNGTGTNTAANEYKTYWTVSGAQKSASVTAIAPDHYDSKGNLTTALDLTNCQNAGDKKYVISNKNLIYKKVTDEIGTEHLYVSFPTKAYLAYDVIFYKGNSFDTYYAQGSASSFGVKDTTKFTTITVDQNFYKMDSTTNRDVVALGAGTWKAVVKVSAPGTGYVDSYVFAKDTVTIDAVDNNGENTAIVDADTSATGVQTGYIDSGKTIRVIWKAAKNSNNKAWAADKYKVYVADGVNKAAANYTALDAALIKTDAQKTEPVYYIDYTVTDNTAPYTFWVVLSDNGKLETSVPSVTVAKYADKPKVNFVTTGATPDTVTAAFADKDNDGTNNDALLTINVPSNTGINKAALITVKSVKYKKVAANDNTLYTLENLWLDSEITEVGVAPSADYTKYEAIVKDVAIGTQVVFLYTLQQENKADLINVIATTNVSNAVATILPGEFDIAAVAGDTSKFKVSVIPGGATGTYATKPGTPANFDAKENFTYKVYYARVEDAASVANITKWEEASVAIKWDTDANTLSDSTTVGNAWKSVKEQDVSSVFVDEYKTTLDSSGKKEKNGKGATVVFKFVKTKGTVNSVSYSGLYTGHKD